MKQNQYKNLKIQLENKNEITLKQEIGSGSFSNVYLTSNSSYVAKVMNLNYVPSQRSFINERKYYQELGQHSNIVQYLGSQELQGGSLGVLVIENCPKGSLVDIMSMTPKNQLSEQQILRVIYEVAQGLSHIHKRKLIHRDIKIENILYSEENRFKICDFGSVTNNLVPKISKCNIQDIKEEMDRNTTPMYRAPEILDPHIFPDYPINEKIDIFALGVLAYILCFKKPPFDSILGAISGSCLWPEFPITSDEFHNFIMRMLSINPADRPSANEIIQIITKDLKFEYKQDGMIDPYIFTKQAQKEAKASWLQIINAKFIGAFFDTQGWIKGALQYDEYGPKQKYVRKLLLKAWKKRPKTDKFYMLLYNHWKEHRSNTIINLKILILLHNYFKKGPPEAIKNPVDRKISPEKILDDIQQNWQKIILDGELVKPKDQKRSQYTCNLIVNLTKFLQTKLLLNQKYSQYFEGNFSLNPFLESAKKKFKPLDPLLLPDLIEYLAVILKFVNVNLLHQCQLWNIQATISLSMLDEIYCLLCLTIHLYKTFKISTNFESHKFDENDIRQFIKAQDINLEKIYKQAQLYFQRCSLITETKLPIATMIPKLPNNVIEYIKQIEILTNSEPEFKIFEHLNYKQNIYGIKLPLSYGPGVIDAIKQTEKQFENGNVSSVNAISSKQYDSKRSPHQQQFENTNQITVSNQSQHNQRAHSANPQKNKQGTLDSDDQSDEGEFMKEYQQKMSKAIKSSNDQTKNEYIFAKKPANSNAQLPVHKSNKPFIPNPYSINGMDKQFLAQEKNQINSFPNSQKHDFWAQPQQANQEVINLFEQFQNNLPNGQAIQNQSNQNEDMFNQFTFWDPSHPMLVGYQKEKDEKYVDNSKGQGFFEANDLNRSVIKDNNKCQDLIDLNIFDEQINIDLLKLPSQQPHVTQPINSNPFDFWSNINNNLIQNLEQMQKNGQNTNQNNEDPNNKYNNFQVNNMNNQQAINNQNGYQINNQNNQQINNYQVNNYQLSNQNNSQGNNQNNYNYQQYNQNNYQINNQNNYQLEQKNVKADDIFNDFGQQNNVYDYTNANINIKQNLQNNFYMNQQQVNQLDNFLQNEQNQQKQQNQQIYNQNFYNQIYDQQNQIGQGNVNQQNDFNNNQLQNQNLTNQQFQQQIQNQLQMIYQQQLSNMQEQQYIQINNPFLNKINQNNVIQINTSPRMSPPKQFQDESIQNPTSYQNKEEQLLDQKLQLQNQIILQQQQEQPQTQRRSKKLIGAEDSNDEEKQNKKEALQRLGSENIPDDDCEALRPLDSFLGQQKAMDPSQQMRKSISPFKSNKNHLKFQNETEHEKVEKDLEQLKLEQCQSKIRKHPELVNYIKHEVSSEFFDFIVDFSEIKMGNKIGSGNSCEVYKGRCKNKDVAIKVIKLDNSDELHLKEFQREIQALIKLKNHENLLQLVAISSYDNNFYIITEFCEGGTLFELLHKKKQQIKMIKWDHRIRWLKDLAKGMLYLHQNNLIHRDLKSLNLLFDKPYDPNSDNIPTMKIADFGLTRVGSSQAVPFQSGALGTFHWMAPETMRNQPVSTQADVYSFAIVMYELASRETPFKEKGNVAAIIKYVSEEKGRPNLQKLHFDTPQFIIKLMIKCWDENPKKRPKFDQIIQVLENPTLMNQLAD
ncbi:tyrosine kinase domain protein (macronuclear) [Tetrahymena thermophila SB210]|uniref:Tyrosine kinase domain protein n=1 Tax=Tetrahymena thermophila (strain SB210) TaxID=312017 RepID=Q23K41_TETTS|nr:tyrosine kinase domain protein [Tetrahymena thermophila SB210]EAR97002.2 tyrosine kinase domain protein [Tetrahymena thermophila SB210]|eukprot:XP_001017247.2 tyrosine kinase domain protein [Tetrahymena thermophila SB210]